MADCSKCKHKYTCSEGMQEVLSANCIEFESDGTPAESRYSRELEHTCNCKTCIKSRTPKSLAQYLSEYLEHELINGSDYRSHDELFEQALDAYESTEQVKIRIERI